MSKHWFGAPLRWVKKRYAVMVLEGPERGVRHFSIPAPVVPLVLVLGVLGLAGLGTALVFSIHLNLEQASLERLRRENLRLTTQLDEIRESVELVESRVRETEEIEREFRNLANLTAIPEDVRALGIGGPPSFRELSDRTSPSTAVREARGLKNRLDGLSRQAAFQTANFEEMVVSLERSGSELARIPSTSPVPGGLLTSGYGSRRDPFTGGHTMHHGLDFSAPEGTPVFATADGWVSRAEQAGTAGLLVEVDHGNGIRTRFGHNSRILVKVGDSVKRGDLIAEVGSTGRSTSPHCHYEVRVHGDIVNPLRYILDQGYRTYRRA